MERHRCKLCTRTFANGRALGGHMKAHLATLPLPTPKMTTQQQLAHRNNSPLSSYSSYGEDEEEQEIKDKEVEEKSLVYGLRENPKKSFRLADPEFSFVVDTGFVVQDRESETESRNPTRRRSKRTRKSGSGEIEKPNFDVKKLKIKSSSSVESPAYQEPLSSVSDTAPEEDVAMCLMMLSRDVWMRNKEEQAGKYGERSVEMLEESVEAIKVRKNSVKFRCEKCNKLFRSSRALSGHKRICCLNATKADERIFECPYCLKVFGSGQALGGHKRSHLITSSMAATTAKKSNNNLLDLNLPASEEDDEFSVVSEV